jgi:hypothetical protein
VAPQQGQVKKVFLGDKHTYELWFWFPVISVSVRALLYKAVTNVHMYIVVSSRAIGMREPACLVNTIGTCLPNQAPYSVVQGRGSQRSQLPNPPKNLL